MSESPPRVQLDWDEAAAMLTSASPWVSPAELHGLYCGSVCARAEAPSEDAWLLRVFEHAGEEVAAGADHGDLVRFAQRALAGLTADDFSFELLLPDEETELSQRIENLSRWCEGFLSGFGLGGGAIEDPAGDAAGALRDLVAIAGADADVEGSEEEESDFVQLVEYVRVAVLVILGQDR